jgi:TonB family protein
MRIYLVMVVVLFLFNSKGYAQNSAKQKKETVDQKMPQFPGGDDAFYTYLDKNVVLPDGFDKKKYVKKHKNKFVPISVGFTVDVDGSITNVNVIDKTNEMLDKKAKEIVENMPKWEPGYQNGAPIKVQYAIPVRFNLM